MFQHVLLDNGGEASEHRKRFFSCIYLVADTCAPAIFYLHNDWRKLDLLQDVGVNVENLSEDAKQSLAEKDLLPGRGYQVGQPRLTCMLRSDWKAHDGVSGLPVRVPKREFVLSESQIVNKAYLLDRGLNATTVTLALGAVGLDILLPNVNFDLLATDELEELKEKFGEERALYLSTLTAISAGAFERFQNSNYSDLISWAENEVMLKLVPQARLIEESVKKAPHKTLRAAGASFWKEGIPSVGSAYFGSGIQSAGKELAIQMFKALTAAIEGQGTATKSPEYSYAMKIAKAKG